MANPLQRLLVAPVLIDDEDSGPLELLEAALAAELAPVGSWEAILVGKLAADLWRLRRVVEAESLAIMTRIDADASLAAMASADIGLSSEALAEVGLSESVGEDEAITCIGIETTAGKRRIAAPADDRLGKYESRLQASALAIMRELRTVQALRKEADSRA